MKRYRKKVMLLGDGAVGKTSLVRRYVYNTFSDHYIATIGAKTCTKDVDYEEHGIALNMVIWDIIGQQGFERTQMVNMRGTNAVLMVCDLTRAETADSIEKYWIPLIEEAVGKTPPMIFLGNKSDLLPAVDETHVRSVLFSLAKKI
ncbi:MAG: GTP-binding protein [Thermoplasmata archaeon]|nr:MAG: GTP-binding protein [Thermoplasmata archaeon]